MKALTVLRSRLAHWEQDLPASWRQVLGGTLLNWDSPALEYELRPGEAILPAPDGGHLWRAFENTDPRKVRAVLLGQDPYPNATWATGRAFEQGGLAEWPDEPRRLAASLRRMVQAMVAARTGDAAYAAGDRAWKKLAGDARGGRIRLEPPRELFDRLEREGVLFLNASLTLSVLERPGARKQSRRHFPLWEPLTQRVLRWLASRQSGCAVFLLLGRVSAHVFDRSGAQGVADHAGTWKKKVDAVRHCHPAAIDSRGAAFLLPPNPFRTVNNLLRRMGGSPVSW